MSDRRCPTRHLYRIISPGLSNSNNQAHLILRSAQKRGEKIIIGVGGIIFQDRLKFAYMDVGSRATHTAMDGR